LLSFLLQLKIVHELQESMMSCSNAFVGVAVMGIALSVAAAHGLEVEDAPEVCTDWEQQAV
jgi:hypothetical protein